MLTGQLIELRLKARGDLITSMETIVKTATDETRGLTDDERTLLDETKTKIKAIDTEVESLREAEALAAKGATPAGATPAAPAAPGAPAAPTPGLAPAADPAKAGAALGAPGAPGTEPHIVATRKDVPKGIRLARCAYARAWARKHGADAVSFAKNMWPETPEVELVLRAQVDAGSTTDPTWAEPLVEYERMAGEFIELLRPMSIMARFPGRRLQFGRNGRLIIPKSTGRALGGYVGERGSIRVSSLSFGTIEMMPSKLAVLIPVSNELLDHANPSAESVIRDQMLEDTAELMDAQFINGVAIAGVQPAGLAQLVLPANTRPATAAAPTAPTVPEATDDIEWSLTTLEDADVPMTSPIWFMPNRTRNKLRFQRTAQDVFAWKTEIDQGVLAGYPLLASNLVPKNLGAGNNETLIGLVDANQVFIAEDLMPIIDASTEATIQSNDAPATPPDLTGGDQISAYQQDLTIFRLRMRHTWTMRHQEAITVLSGVRY